MTSLTRRRFLRSGLPALGAAAVLAKVRMARATEEDAGPATARAGASARISATDLVPADRGAMTLLQGAGCNVVAVRGPEGSLLVDGGLAARSGALLKAAAASTGNARVNTLINTHWHPPQTGSNEPVGREHSSILAHEMTLLYLGRSALSTCYAGSYGPLPRTAWPTKTTRDKGSLEFAGQHVDYVYLPAAHTNGDLYIHFPERDLLVGGGPFSAEAWPILDIRNGAWIGGLVQAHQTVAALVKPSTRIVPANGRLLTGALVARQRDMYRLLFKQLFVYFNKGYGPSDVIAARPLAAYEAQYGDPARFLDGAYRSLFLAYVPD
ncbi:MAG: MBL fold metallo-hydrolase [Steroidobacteraceae bacterium]